jgi:hypothetical protein
MKAQGLGIQILGFLMFLGSVVLGVASLPYRETGGLVIAGILFFLSIGLMWYGGQLRDKAKHIAWTQEALRRYDAKYLGPRRRAQEYLDEGIIEEYEQQPQEKKSKLPRGKVYCRYCAAVIGTRTHFCPECGKAQR